MANTSPDNSYIFDPESPAEMARLTNQARALTKGMGNVFVGLTNVDIAGLRNVIDVGCGPGGWVLDVAFAYPEIEVAGIDISKTMVDYANARASSQELHNASFGLMDFTRPLDFPDASFDLVNARFLFVALRREAWAPFIAECTRILRPGGLLHLTEPIDLATSSSPSYTRMSTLFYQTLWRSGYAFSTDGQSIGLTYMLPRLLRKAGYQDIKLLGHAMDFSADTEYWADGFRDLQIAYYQSLPLFVKLGLVTQEEAQHTYDQMIIECYTEDFCIVWHYMTTLGQKPLSTIADETAEPA
jgi:ubiquinone/menaquinone biosynthesis C-methylase UbiE